MIELIKWDMGPSPDANWAAKRDHSEKLLFIGKNRVTPISTL
jgi:hypothetical protein